MAKKDTKADTKTSRCWPGYEPVPGKEEHEEGSCRKKPKSRNGGKEPDRERSRKKQIALGGERAQQAKTKSPSAAERRSAAKSTTKKSTAKKPAGKKSGSKKSSAKKSTAKKSTSKQSTAKKTSVKKT